MKKSIIALTFACASAFAYAGDVTRSDSTQWNENWFQALVSPTAITSLGAVNAAWSGLTTSNAEVSDSKLVLDLDTTDTANIALGGTTPPVDTNTCHVIKFTAVLTPIAASDLQSILPEEGVMPQTGFALVYDSTYSSPYNYQVWDGLGWRESNIYLDSAPTSEVSVEVYVDYWTNDAKRVSVKVGDNFLYFENETTIYQPLATESNNVASVQIKGSGTIASLKGDVQYAVAQIGIDDDVVKYPTLASAVAASDADESEEERAVVVLRPNTEEVTVNKSQTVITDPSGNAQGKVTPGSEVTIKVIPVAGTKEGESTPGVIAASGTYTLNTKVDSAEDLERVKIVITNANKEVASKARTSDGYIKITTQTSGEVLSNATESVAGMVKPSSAGLALIRGQLNDCPAAKTLYEAANASETTMAEALQMIPCPVAEGGNGLKVWELAAMNISKETSIKPIGAPTGQTGTIENTINLAIPDLSGVIGSRGDYTVSYKYNDGTTDHTIDNPAAFTVPNNANGTYTIKAVITPKN